MKVEITEPVIEQVLKIKHPGAWKASFKMKSGESPLVIDMELGAPTEERLKEKINHLKETGIILRG